MGDRAHHAGTSLPADNFNKADEANQGCREHHACTQNDKNDQRNDAGNADCSYIECALLPVFRRRAGAAGGGRGL